MPTRAPVIPQQFLCGNAPLLSSSEDAPSSLTTSDLEAELKDIVEVVVAIERLDLDPFARTNIVIDEVGPLERQGIVIRCDEAPRKSGNVRKGFIGVINEEQLVGVVAS